ncbi:isoamyl acetate-hydrolyzing esterase 1 homolog [Nephila pilipes]|uniref:Isoamyl acetate-hydrolyzing esterase 1 homolog n=1 Tax=Nephila pilipes TaxID=299642 RepID=A0A8X6MMQ2_NEPPI|nr:isoamyl acetate-hydrolyzing esterase 1 homolog [Nephila pilipes]
MSLKWPKIVLFGDSQVQRSFGPDGSWGALLANRLQRICDVIPRGFSGYTSRSCRIILPHIFYPENISDVEVFVICLGTNDSSGKEDAPQYHVPLQEYAENLDEMIKYLQNIGLNKNKIILMTPGPYHHEKFMKWCCQIGKTFPSKDNKITAEYVQTCLGVAKKHNLDAINTFQEIMKNEDWSKFLIDGLHFSHDGSHLIYYLLRPLIEKKIDISEMLLPHWRDINHIKPKDADEDLCYKINSQI